MLQYQVEAQSLGIGETEDERRFVWLQSPAFTGARVRLAEHTAYERDGGFTEENSFVIHGTTMPVRRDEPFVSCKVRVTGLAPDTAYVYTVGCDTAYEEKTHSFRMPKVPNEHQRFFMISDLHINAYRRAINKGDPDGMRAVARFAETLKSAAAYGGDTPDFMLSLGDNISVGNMPASFYPNPEEYSKYASAEYAFREYREYLMPEAMKEIASASVLGNHDAIRLDATDEPIGDVNNVLCDPPHDDGYSGHYHDSSSGDFWFVSGDLLVVGINAMVKAEGNCTACAYEVHRAYIERAVAEAPATKWRILLCHVPAYSYVEGAEYRVAGTTGGTTGERTERARMADFFSMLSDPFGFDIVFTGHQHAFSRTYPLLDGRVVGEEARTVERHEDNTVTETLTRPHGVIHYNLSAAMNHAFFSNLPMEPEALYPAYGVTEAALTGGAEVPNADKFAGVTYKSSTYTYVTLSHEGDEAVMTVSAVRADTGEAFDTLIIRK